MHGELSQDKNQGESRVQHGLNPRGNSRGKLSRRQLQNDMTAGALAFVKLGSATLFRPEDVRGYVEARRISRRRYR